MLPLSKSKLKELVAFKQQKVCDSQGFFVAEGEKLAAEIIAMRVPIHTLCATGEWFDALQAAADASLCLRDPRQAYVVTGDQLGRLSSMRQPNKVWMLIERSACGVHNYEPETRDQELILVLDRIQDPGNLGTIIRTADWFGIRHIVCSPDTVSCFNPTVVQSTMGSLFRVGLGYCDLHEWLSTCGMPVYGATLDGDDLRHSRLSTPAVLVVGNESRGISPSIRSLLTHRIAIPNTGGTCESLNAAVATAILVSRFVL